MFKRIYTLLVSFWHLLKVFGQMLYGTWRISKLDHPIITIFGSARIKQDDPYSLEAALLSKRILDANISILTGGGPGIMEAASCAVVPVSKNMGKNIGIGVKGLTEGKNHCVGEYFELNYFFARKWLLVRFSKAYIVFPGGFGTFDEMFEVLTLIQTRKMERKPIILMNTQFWAGFMAWMNNDVLKHDLIDVRELELFVITDDVDRAFGLVMDSCKDTSGNKKPQD